MKKLSNIKIGKKLGLAVAGAIFLVICLTAVGIWSVGAMNRVRQESDRGTRMTTLAERVNADVAHVCMSVASLPLYRQFHAASETRIGAARKRYVSGIEELKSLPETEEGKRLLADVEQTITAMQ